MSSTYDQALQLISGMSPEGENHFPNNVPLIADALIHLDHEGAVLPWIQNVLNRLPPMPPSHMPVNRDNWRQAVGDMSRIQDWVTFFQRELKQNPWKVILRDWIPRLAPGLAGAAGHGLLRTASSVRHLALAETDLRKSELATGLGYWAARFTKLPGIIGGASIGNITPLEALSHIKWQHKKRPPQLGSISEGLRGLSEFSPFGGVANLIKIHDEPPSVLSQITEAMARVSLAHSPNPAKRIPFILAMAVPSALRFLIHFVEVDQTVSLLRYSWQFAGAIYTIYGRANPAETWDQPDMHRDQLIEKSVSSGEEYAVLFTEICLREYTDHPHPVYWAAAWEAVNRIASAAEDPHRDPQL